ncbi:hypothetical protein [Polaribacter sp. Hel_I_88]|uniref:hypothetical protein n=1 Tax=Polaribacter sp. Hel_I_88 TaxID=1250006 RepID=UPI00047CEE1F|nr:hypothetical protein [Polaribacter sp. Hel_I_88]|tara:strand:+ start:690 stop:929 length:240 start_codon:yes stop_codon:yes gene_type:complete
MKKRNIKYGTNHLLPKNNFWVGMGSILNLAGSYFDYNYSKTEKEADFKAIMSDWENIGDDIKKSKEKFENKNKRELCLK